MIPASMVPSEYLLCDQHLCQVFGTAHSRTCQPDNNKLQDPHIIHIWIIEARHVNENYTAGRIVWMGNNNMLGTRGHGRSKAMANGHYEFPNSSVNELSSGLSGRNHQGK